MSWELTDCTLPDEKEKVQVTYLKNNKEYCDVFAVLVGNDGIQRTLTAVLFLLSIK